jgi:peptide/nickel transport system ATP-binding protein/oligopeptide transport system ATP-binding protein
MEQELLKVNDLCTWFYTSDGIVKAVDGISFSVKRGETLALVGESGSGKSVTSFSITGLVAPPGKIASGDIFLNGVNLTRQNKKQLRAIRGKSVSMVFQEPMTSLNPVLTVGEQISEVFRRHEHLNKADAKEKSIGMIKMVGIPRAEIVYGYYPHMLSGGMRQRIMIAIALACDPELLIADEPTTALDVTIQAQILELMDELIRKRGKSMILITHDLGVVAESADNVIVMYAGKAVEKAPVGELFEKPAHPYTTALLASLPDMQSEKKSLYSIPGSVPNLLYLPKGCAFCPRCSMAVKKCAEDRPALIEVSKDHFVSCHHAGDTHE